jgi:beta-glucosidase
MYKWYIPFFRSWVASEDVPEAEFEKNGKSYTSMGWEIYPDSMLDALRMVQNDYGNPPVIITENGASFADEVVDGRVNDPKRIAFLDAYLRRVQQAMAEGADVRGYFCWSLFDNFEWAEGLSKRFGLIHVDYATQKRTIKQSGYWYRDVIASQARQDTREQHE